MLDRSAFCLAAKSSAKKALQYGRFAVWEPLLSTSEWFQKTNREIEQLANQQANIAILANEWLVQWPQGFEKLYCSARQIVPRRGQLYPTKWAFRNRSERWLLIANFRCFMKTSQAKSVYLGSGGGKNATTAAIRWIIVLR